MLTSGVGSSFIFTNLGEHRDTNTSHSQIKCVKTVQLSKSQAVAQVSGFGRLESSLINHSLDVESESLDYDGEWEDMV